MVLAGRTAEVIRDDRRSGFGTKCGWTIDCTLKYDECEPVICDPFCGSGCLSRAVRVIAFRSLLCASRFVTTESCLVRVRICAVSAGTRVYRPASMPCTLQWFQSFGFEPQETDQQLAAQF